MPGPKSENRALSPVRRRSFLKTLAAVPGLGLVAGRSRAQEAQAQVDGTTGATVTVSTSHLEDLEGALPRGRICSFEISRLIMGGNLIGGWAHARDLLYVSTLFKAYNTEKKIHETLMLGEQAGINTINITGGQFPAVNRYKKQYGSSLQTICQVHPRRNNIRQPIDQAIDHGVDLIQIQGNCCDWRVRDGEVDVIAEAIDYIRAQGYPAGLGAHAVQALAACHQAGIRPDFYMKTLHHDRYWSAHPRENRVPFSVDGKRSRDHDRFHNNMFCLFAEETIEFMAQRSAPFIAFKVLAAGAIHPRDGFRYAFENGADFICAGMFDFQLVDDINIALQTLTSLKGRTRPWCA